MAQLASVDELGELVHIDSDTPWEVGTGLGLVLADGKTVTPADQVDEGIGSLSIDPDEDEDDEDEDDEEDDDEDDDDLDDDDLDEEDDDEDE